MAIIFVGPAGSLAQAQGQVGQDQGNNKLETQRNKLRTTDKKARDLEVSVKELEAARARLNARLVETASLIQKSESRLTAIEQRLDELQTQQQLVRGSLARRRGQIAGLLAALQRMGRNPPPVMITRRDDALSVVRSAMLLSSAFPGLRKQALALTERLNQLDRVTAEIRQERDRLSTETPGWPVERLLMCTVMVSINFE